jgi:hypothetical protein
MPEPPQEHTSDFGTAAPTYTTRHEPHTSHNAARTSRLEARLPSRPPVDHEHHAELEAAAPT